jgi:hypothetical protein
MPLSIRHWKELSCSEKEFIFIFSFSCILQYDDLMNYSLGDVLSNSLINASMNIDTSKRAKGKREKERNVHELEKRIHKKKIIFWELTLA